MSNPSSKKNMDVAKTLGAGKKRSWFSRLFRLAIWCAIIAAVIAGGMKWFHKDTAPQVRYETVKTQRGDLVVTVSATGTLEPIKEVEVGIEVSGTIKNVLVDYNDTVKVGQVLAEIDTSKLNAQTLQSEAALDAARAKLLQAQATVAEAEAQMARLEEVRKLSGGKMPSQYEFDAQKATLARAHADESSAKAAVSQAQATLDVNHTDLSKAVVHSPIDGVVLTRSVEPGQTVAAQFNTPTLFTLAEDLTKMKLMVDVDEADVGQVRADQDATFTVDAYPDRVFPARTTQVRYGSETVDGVVTYKAVLTVDNASLELLPGMTATASITVNKCEHALLIPNAALRFIPPREDAAKKPGESNLLFKILPHPPMHDTTPHAEVDLKGKNQKVWTLRDGQLTAIPIVKGLSDGKMTEVTEGGLEEGVELVTGMETPK